ncbi:patatin-like phospholipase family protein [Desertibaculum subflavum]|uniref:patatin-like phospholipase family protein n=1 Tax=Desertibaculum subflavum TaxID=2268458 RepID=UPI000E6617CD
MSEAQPPAPPPSSHGRPKGIKLALQGGGSHGAFTWGVLDRLLEDERLEIEAISGTSAGAMNAAVLASGHASGDRQGARAALDAFWGEIGREATWSLIQRTPLDRLFGNWRIDNSPGYIAMDMLGRVFSPYQLPDGLNPLKDVLEKAVDFDAIRYACRIGLHIGATSVRTGKVKVFENREVCIEAVLASACLPFLFRAVEVKGEAYYDGGYVGNPAIWPLIYAPGSRDIVIVQVNPVFREAVPTTAREIQDRVNEITFNSSLIAEMRAINFVNRLIAGGKLDPSEYRHTNMHLIDGTDVMVDLHASTKLNAEPEFLTYLKGLGRTAADKWLEQDFDKIGAAGTCNIAQQYL